MNMKLRLNEQSESDEAASGFLVSSAPAYQQMASCKRDGAHLYRKIISRNHCSLVSESSMRRNLRALNFSNRRHSINSTNPWDQHPASA